MLQHCPLRQPFLKEDRARAGKGRGEESPAWRARTGAGVPLGTGQRTRASPGCSERWTSPLYPVSHCTPPGQIWGGPGSEDGLLAAASSRAQTCSHSALWARGGHLARPHCRVPVPQCGSGRAWNPCPLSPVLFLVPHLIMTGPAPKSSKMDSAPM